MNDTTDRDKLRQVIADIREAGFYTDKEWADAILADFLPEHDKQVRADAWDEGEVAGLRRADFEYGHALIQAVKTNPYRRES